MSSTFHAEFLDHVHALINVQDTHVTVGSKSKKLQNLSGPIGQEHNFGHKEFAIGLVPRKWCFSGITSRQISIVTTQRKRLVLL